MQYEKGLKILNQLEFFCNELKQFNENIKKETNNIKKNNLLKLLNLMKLEYIIIENIRKLDAIKKIPK